MKRIALLTAAALATLAACSPAADETPAQPAEQKSPAASAAAEQPPAGNDLTLAGLGDLRIGEAVPQGSSWQARGAPVGDGCVTARSDDSPGVYAMIEGGKVRRITAGKGATVKLVEGIAVGATEAATKAKFPGFSEEPHKYEEAPAKNLMTPDLKAGAAGLRFEIGTDGKVSQIHVGQLPTLAYVEGCG